jgi:predicted nucleotidyltransferase component of viral defense system
VEHDLALSRALVEIFSEPTLARSLAFRGGTAIHKLVLFAPQRFSADLDLVQVESGPIGELMRTIQARALASGHFKIIGRFLAHNEASRVLCRLGGWREVGIHQKHARLDGRWYDVALVEFLIPENLARQGA